MGERSSTGTVTGRYTVVLFCSSRFVKLLSDHSRRMAPQAPCDSSQSFCDSCIFMSAHAEEAPTVHHPCRVLSFEEHKPVNQAQPTLSSSLGASLSKDNGAVESKADGHKPRCQASASLLPADGGDTQAKYNTRGGCEHSRTTQGHVFIMVG